MRTTAATISCAATAVAITTAAAPLLSSYNAHVAQTSAPSPPVATAPSLAAAPPGRTSAARAACCGA